MKVLVTGTAGFLAGRVAHALARAGHGDTGFVRDPAKWQDRPPGAAVASGDVTDAAAFRGAAKGHDAIVHAAALVKVWVKDRREFDRVNVGGLRNAVEAARAAGAKLVYTSSFIALGPTDGATFDEDTPRATDTAHNDYERTKSAAEQAAREITAGGFPIVRIYPGVVYGPGALTPGNLLVPRLRVRRQGRSRRWASYQASSSARASTAPQSTNQAPDRPGWPPPPIRRHPRDPPQKATAP